MPMAATSANLTSSSAASPARTRPRLRLIALASPDLVAPCSGSSTDSSTSTLRLVDDSKPRWVVIENPPGLLSSNGGRDMGAVVRGLEDLGYGWAWS